MREKIEDAIALLALHLGEYDGVDSANEILEQLRDGYAAEGIVLERQAVALITQYGLFLPAPAKSFFRKLADYLMWQNLKEKLK